MLFFDMKGEFKQYYKIKIVFRDVFPLHLVLERNDVLVKMTDTKEKECQRDEEWKVRYLYVCDIFKNIIYLKKVMQFLWIYY